jgi:adenylyl-sulfate kinase
MTSAHALHAGRAPLQVLLCGGAHQGKRTLLARLAAAREPAVAIRCPPALAASRMRFVVVDMPAQRRDAARMVDQAAAADVGIVVVDARSALLAPAHRCNFVAMLLCMPRVVLAINKMDLVGNSQSAFAAIETVYQALAHELGLARVAAIPLSALHGDNVTENATAMHWYAGPSLVAHLESGPGDEAAESPFGATTTPSPDADQFEASIAWFGDAPLLRGRRYVMRTATTSVNATIAPLKYRIGLDSLEHVAADRLEHGEVGVGDLTLGQPIAFTAGHGNARFVLVDPLTGDPVGAGRLRFALRRSQNIHWQPVDIDRTARASLKSQRPCVLWFTGLSGAGKSTIANLLEGRLHALGRHTYLLDGDNVRKGLNKDLGFTAEDRVENIRRVAEVAALMADAGLIVITAFISPFRNERRMARGLLPDGDFLEIFVDTPLAVAERRDPKGLYRKARRGELVNFTGIDSPYEPPENAELTIDGAAGDPAAAVERIIEQLRRLGIIAA